MIKKANFTPTTRIMIPSWEYKLRRNRKKTKMIIDEIKKSSEIGRKWLRHWMKPASNFAKPHQFSRASRYTCVDHTRIRTMFWISNHTVSAAWRKENLLSFLAKMSLQRLQERLSRRLGFLFGGCYWKTATRRFTIPANYL